MNTILIKNPIIRVAVLIAILIVVALLGVLIGEIREGAVPALPSMASPRTFTSAALGIAFDYSLQSDIDEEVKERGDCPLELLTDTDRCDHRYLGFPGESTLWFLSAESNLFSMYPLAREGTREDTLHGGTIDDYCTKGLYPLSCEKSVNDYGLSIVNVGYLPACNGIENCENEPFSITFIETKNPAYPILAVWYDRSEKPHIPDSVIDEVVRTMRPYAPVGK